MNDTPNMTETKDKTSRIRFGNNRDMPISRTLRIKYGNAGEKVYQNQRKVPIPSVP